MNVPVQPQSEWQGTGLQLRLLGLAARLRLQSPNRLVRHALPRLYSSSDSISDAMLGLRDGLCELDRRFEDFSDSVATLSSLSQELLQASGQLMHFATGQSEGRRILEESLALIDPSLHFISSCEPLLVELNTRIDSITDRVKQLIRGEVAIKAAVYPLQFTQVMIRIEAATLPDHLLRVFDGLIGEIATLQERVNLTFTQKCQSLSETLPALDGLSRLLAGATEEYRAAGARKVVLDQRLRLLDAEISHNESKDIALDGVAAEVARAVNGLVTSVQAHDIVNQKLVHVLQNIGSLQQRLAAAVTLQDLRSAARTLKVQVLQLEQAHKDLAGVTRQCHEAASDLHARLRSLSHDCLLLSEFDHVVTSADGAVQVLIDAMSDVREMVRSAASQMSGAHGSVGSIADAVSSLTGSAKELAESMRYIALNAQIQAIHVGAGTALEVMAAETEAIARETNRVSEELTGAIVSVTSDLAESRSELGRLKQEAEQQQEVLEAGVEAKRSELHAHRDKTLELFIRTENLLKEIGRQVDRADRTSGFESLIDAPAGELREAMQEAIRWIEEVLAASPELPAMAAEEDGDAVYTMASERKLQEMLAGHRGAKPETPESGLTGGDGGVELF